MRRRFPSSWCRPMAVPVCPRAHLVALPSSAPKKGFETAFLSPSCSLSQPLLAFHGRRGQSSLSVSHRMKQLARGCCGGSTGPRKAGRRQASNQLFLWSCPGRPSMAGLGMGSLERKNE